MSITSIILLITYSLLIVFFIKGWDRIAYFTKNEKSPSTPVSIITACKNEIQHLPQLFQALNKQTYQNFEFILVDDGSTDGSFEYAQQASSNFSNLNLLKNQGKGKKHAIKTGIYQTNNELIISHDADSIPSTEWLETIVSFYEENPADMIICPVKTGSNGSFFQEMQQFEFASLVGSGAGAVGAGVPLLCNGANLAFTKSAWLASEQELHFDEPSGDDIFLLQSIKRKKGQIRFLKSSKAMTTTQSSPTLKSFLNQRIRWAGKRVAYKDFMLAFTGFTVFASSFVILASLILAVFNQKYLELFLFVFTLKWFVDFIFLKRIKELFALKNIFSKSFLLSLIYPFYILFTASKALFGKKTSW